MTVVAIAPRVVQRGSPPLAQRLPKPVKPVGKDHPLLGNFPDSRSHPKSPGDGSLLPLTTHRHPNWFPHRSLLHGSFSLFLFSLLFFSFLIFLCLQELRPRRCVAANCFCRSAEVGESLQGRQPPTYHHHLHRIIQSLRLEKTTKVIKPTADPPPWSP